MAKSTTTRSAPKHPPPKIQAQQTLNRSTTKYPFIEPPPPLLRFLETLPPNHIYLLHTDTFPIDHKRRIFLVPLLLNIFLSILILYRAYTAIPTYFAILLATLGHHSNASVDIPTTTWPTLVEIGSRRAAMFFFDFALYQFVTTWPLDFFRWGQPLGPAIWRWKIGYKAREVVVRRSRRWGEQIFAGEYKDEAVLGEGQIGGKVYKERVLPGIDAAWVRGRTGMSMLDQNWDLWYQGMAEAQMLIEKDQIKIKHFNSRMVVVHESKRGWLIWKCDHDKSNDGNDNNNNNDAEKIKKIKTRLDTMGKEGLFWKWIEMVQFETEMSDEINNTVGAAAVRERLRRKGRDLFAREGVDFEDFWKKVGGFEDMPGLKSSSSSSSTLP